VPAPMAGSEAGVRMDDDLLAKAIDATGATHTV
jgi:hypothetical protein